MHKRSTFTVIMLGLLVATLGTARAKDDDIAVLMKEKNTIITTYKVYNEVSRGSISSVKQLQKQLKIYINGFLLEMRNEHDEMTRKLGAQLKAVEKKIKELKKVSKKLETKVIKNKPKATR